MIRTNGTPTIAWARPRPYGGYKVGDEVIVVGSGIRGTVTGTARGFIQVEHKNFCTAYTVPQLRRVEPERCGISDVDQERILDRRVQHRLATDRAYRNAENAEEQSQREQEIEQEEIDRLNRERETAATQRMVADMERDGLLFSPVDPLPAATTPEDFGPLFARYIRDGHAAIDLHPDRAQLDLDTAAVDMIASIMHAVCDDPEAQDKREPSWTRSMGGSEPDELLARALRSYHGDREDIDPPPELCGFDPTPRTATRRRELRASVRDALGTTRTQPPDLPALLRAAREMARLLDLTSGGHYGLAVWDFLADEAKPIGDVIARVREANGR